MEKKKIAILQGDYSGPEMMQAGLAVLAAVSQNTDFEYELNQYYLEVKQLMQLVNLYLKKQ